MAATAKTFDRNHQFVRVLLDFSWRWLMTAVLCASIAGTIYGYNKRRFDPDKQINIALTDEPLPSALNESDKRIFSTLVTGLQIGLSVNVTAAIADISLALRWLIISRVHLPPKTFNLVMANDNTWNLVRLLFSRSTRWALRLFCIVWVIVFLAAQIGTALIGLTFDVLISDDVTLRQAISVGNGQMNDLSFVGPDHRIQGLAQQRSYVSLVWPSFLSNPANEAFLNSYRDPANGQNIFALNLTNFGAAQKDTIFDAQLLPSERVLRANATCTEITITPDDRGINSTTTVPFIRFRNGTVTDSLQFLYNTTNTTTFAQRRIPSPRSAELLVYWKRTIPNGTPQADDQVGEDALFNCTNHVMQAARWQETVDGTPRFNPESRAPRLMPDDIASLWAAASGWTLTNPLALDQQNPYDNSALGFQSRPTSVQVADVLANSSLNAIYVQDTSISSRRISEIDLKVPADSYSVVPKWDKVGLNLGLIAGIHLLLVIGAAVRLRRVLIVDSSPLNLAVLLRHAVRNIGPGGAMLSSKEVAELVHEPLAYGWRDDVDAELKNGNRDDVRQLLVGGPGEGLHLHRFPNGSYY